MSLHGKTILITGAARRLGRVFALAAAGAGANIAVHYGHSAAEAEETCQEIRQLGVSAEAFECDLLELARSESQAAGLIAQVNLRMGPLYGLVNSAAIFASLDLDSTHLEDWHRHLDLNLTAPFLLSQAFARQVLPQGGRIVNILDWRALRPGMDHFPYTISKAALAALTRSLAQALAPTITVNGLALGAIIPPSGQSLSPDQQADFDQRLLANVPARRWAELPEVGQALIFLLDGPAYLTGEIIHLDGGRHLV